MVIQKWTQLRNRRFLKDTQKIIQEGGLDVEADATAEQVFSKRPLQKCWEFDHLKVDATAQQTFLKSPLIFFKDHDHPKVYATAQQAFLG
jgi:hypothetical protein